MGNRKQPFGYRMELGMIVVHPQEAELVEHIFQQYISGSTYNTLVAKLREQTIPYDTGKAWNKNMVARILADRRYTGEGGFPAIITQDTLISAIEKRAAKQVPVKKTEAQKLLRRLSGHAATQRTEQQVLGLLNGLIGNPERIQAQSIKTGSAAKVAELQRKLDSVMAQQPIDEDAAKEMIKSIAAAQYSLIGDEEYETVRIRRIYENASVMPQLNAELLQSTVSAIQVYSDGSISVRLKNHQIVGRSEKQ